MVLNYILVGCPCVMLYQLSYEATDVGSRSIVGFFRLFTLCNCINCLHCDDHFFIFSSCTVTLMLGTTESQLTSSRWLLPLEVLTESTHITCSLVVDTVKRALFCSGFHLLSSFHHLKFTCFLEELTGQFWPLFDIATDTLSNLWYLFFLWVGQKNC